MDTFKTSSASGVVGPFSPSNIILQSIMSTLVFWFSIAAGIKISHLKKSTL